MEPLLLLALSLLLSILFPILLLKLLFPPAPTPTPSAKLPPSPPSLPLIGHLHLLTKPLHRSLTRLSSHHGPILYLRFGFRPTVVISAPTLAEQCFTRENDIALANRPRFPSIKEITNDFSTLIFSPYGPRWRSLRKIATVHVLSNHRLLSSTAARNHEAGCLVRRLFAGAADEKSSYTKVNVKEIAFEYVLNVMMGMIAGKRYYGEESKNWEEAREFRKLIEQVAATASGSRLVDFFPWFNILDFVLVRRKIQTVVKKRNEVSQKLINEIRNGVDAHKKKTMIGDILRLQEREPEVYTDAVIRSLTLSLLQAGTDTSSNTIEWAMSLLLNNPKALTKAQHEINTVVGKQRLLEESDIPNLPYLQAIIKETLRLHPAVPLNVPHESSTECIIDGHRIPSGTTLLVNIHAIHRDPVFWESPTTEFRPERFENGKADGMWFLPFGMGRRKCPGEGLAMRMIALALGNMVQCFEWERIGGHEVDMAEGAGIVMAKEVRLDALYRPRPEMVPLLSGL